MRRDVFKHKMKLKARSLLKLMGFDLFRWTPDNRAIHRITEGLIRHKVTLVLDIGANTGQFAQELRDYGYTGRIVSFEPLSMAHAALLEVSNADTKWQVYPRCAVGASEAVCEINISSNSVSSSLLPMLPAHAEAATSSLYVGHEIVSVVKLDHIIDDIYEEGDVIFMKIDTQGFEWNVLLGAVETLKITAGVVCELSTVPLYAGQKLWREILDLLEASGFHLWSINKGFTDQRSGQMLQMDALLFRKASDAVRNR